jgi:hypothetical protein
MSYLKKQLAFIVVLQQIMMSLLLKAYYPMDKTILPVNSMQVLHKHLMQKSFWSVQQIFKTRKTAEKVDAHLRQFGGATSNRTAGVLFMRTADCLKKQHKFLLRLIHRYDQLKKSQNLRPNCKNIIVILVQAIYRLLV